MGVGRGWKIALNPRNCAILWIFVGILLVQGALGEESTNATNSTETTESDSGEDVEVVSLVKKDKRQAQRGYTDVPLEQGPFDELIASSPAPIAFENDLPTFVDSLSDIADATPQDYNSNNNNKFTGFVPASSNSEGNREYPSPRPSPSNRPITATERSHTVSLSGGGPSSSPRPGPSPSPSPSSRHAVVISSNVLGSLNNVSRPAGFFNQNQIPIALNNGVSFGPVSSGSGLSGPGITPTGRLTDSLALPDNTAAAAINLERRQAELPGGINEPPPFNGKAIPGEAGIDYPIYGEVPRTQFSCKDHQWPGYYADTQSRCQVFWICQKHRMDGFLCPNGTLFNQQVFVCDWWFNVDCSAAPEYYSRNQFIYAGPGIGIDGQRVRGLSLPISASNRVSNVLPPLPPPLRNNALLTAQSQGSHVQSTNQVARVAPVTARPPDFQSRADSLNNYLKSQGGTSAPSYQSQLVNRLSHPNRLHEIALGNANPTTLPPPIPSRDRDTDRRLASPSSQISQAQITSGTSRPTIVSSYQPQHVETVSIVTTSNPTTRNTTPRPPPPPIPKLHISPSAKPIKGPSPSPFGNVIKLGTTVTISTTNRPNFSTKQSLFKGIISSTVKPSKSGIFKLSNSNLLTGPSQTKSVSHHPSVAPAFHPRQVTTEDPTNTVRPADYTPSRAPDPTPPGIFHHHAPGAGFLPPTNRPHSQYVDSSGFGREGKQYNHHQQQQQQQHHQYFVSSTGIPDLAHGMRSNQFSNTNGQRENIYASTSRKDTFVEFPYSPSQQKNKQKQQAIASSKDISGSKVVVTAIPHFYGQRSNVFGGTDSFSFISNNNKRVLIDHTNYSQRQGPFQKTTPHPSPTQHDPRYLQRPPLPQQQQHHQPRHHSSPPPQQLHHIHHTTPIPHSTPQPYLDNRSPSPSHPTPSFAQQQHIPQQSHHIPVSPKPEQRFIVTLAPSPSPQHFSSSPPQHFSSSPAPYHHQQHAPPSQIPRNFHLPSQQPQQNIQHHPPPQYTRHDAVTVRDGFTPLNAGSYISIQTTAAPFSQQILKHNSLQINQEGNRHNGNGVITYSSTGPPPPPQQVIFSDPPTTINNNLGHFVTSTASSRAFDHRGPPQQQNIGFSSTLRPHVIQSTQQPFYHQQQQNNQQHHNQQQHNQQHHNQQQNNHQQNNHQQNNHQQNNQQQYHHLVTPTPRPLPSTPYTTPNNFIAAPTQSAFRTTSPGHRTNPYLPHNHGKKSKHRQHPQHAPPNNNAGNNSPSQFPQGGITTTIKYPEGTGKLRLDFSGAGGGGGGSNRKNIVDFTYSATPTSATPSNYISSTTPYPPSNDRFHHAVSSTTARPPQHSPAPSGRGRFAGAITNKSNLSSSAIYVDNAVTSESVSTPVSVPSPSATTPSSAPLPPVSTSNYGLRLSATAKKRMTGAWQSYFSSKSE